jgi:hypothetical protein
MRRLFGGVSGEGLGAPIAARSHLSVERRRALEILAVAGLRGCTGATLLAHGFSVDMIADLVKGGLATAHHETMRTGRRKIKVARVRITYAGRRALERFPGAPPGDDALE